MGTTSNGRAQPRSQRPAPGRATSPNRRRTQQQRSDETRARILDAAIECVVAEGLPRTNLARIASHAGLSLGAIQHQLGDKAGVLAAVVERGFDRLIESVAEMPVRSGPLPERVAAFVGAMWERYSRTESRAALEVVLQMRADPAFRARTVPHLLQIRGAIDRMWMGIFWELGAPRSSHVRAQRLLFTTLNGLAVEATLLPGSLDVSDDLEALASGIVRILGSAEGEPLA